jgi:hypothetical protein
MASSDQLEQPVELVTRIGAGVRDAIVARVEVLVPRAELQLVR